MTIYDDENKGKNQQLPIKVKNDFLDITVPFSVNLNNGSRCVVELWHFLVVMKK